MSTGVTLRPLGIGDILDRSFKLYTQNFALFAGIYALTLVPAALVQILVAMSLNPRSPASFALYALVSVVAGLAQLVPYTALIHAVSMRSLGRAVTIGEAYSCGFSRLLPLLGSSIIVGILATLPAFTIIGIIASVFLYVRWGLFAQTSVIEQAGVRGALSRSWTLTKGFWWKTFLTMLLLLILLSVVSGVLSSILLAIVAAFGFSVGGGLEAMFGLGTGIPSAANIAISALSTMIASPLLTIGATLLYYDLRVRKEGYDLELMAQELDRSSSGITPE